MDEILEIFINILEYRYHILADKEYALIDQNYIDMLYQLNESAVFQADEEMFNGAITGVEPTGEIIIALENGENRKFWYKEVAFV